jgi:hypothetical protein
MGRPKGAKNKTTIARAAAWEREMASRRAGLAKAPPLAKERLEELCNIFADRAAKHQPGEWLSVVQQEGKPPVRVNSNPDYSEEQYRYWIGQYRDTLRDLAPYQSPRLSAVAVGQATKMTVVVKGGIPPRPLTQADADRIADEFGLRRP